MTGDAPQPGETPRSEDNPWSFADPDPGWWRGETDRRSSDEPPGGRPRHPRRRPTQSIPPTGGTGVLLPPGYQRAEPQTADAQAAHAAGARDLTEGLDPAVRQRTAEPPPLPAAEPRTEPAGVERDHEQPDPFRYDPLRPPAGYAAQQSAETVAADRKVTGEPDPAPEAGQADQADEPDVMVLPEPGGRGRPTVPLERGPVPGESPSGVVRPGRALMAPGEPLPRPTGSPATDARLEKLENSPFWLGETVAGGHPATHRSTETAADARRRHGRHAHRGPAPALLALVALALVATFFAWVSAEPFWLAVGHGDQGYATTTHCTGTGVTQRCTGHFTSVDGGYSLTRVTLLGVAAGGRAPGSVAAARMVSPDSHQAYLGDTSLLVQLRWILGFALVLFCGYGIAGLTGARRLTTARARRAAVLVCLAGPLAMLAGFLLATY